MNDDVNVLTRNEGVNHHSSRDMSSKGPYLLCAFISSILLLAVGTFVTSHAFSDDQKDTILVIIGPSVLIIGGILMSGTVTICLIACYKNKDMNVTELEDYLSIGASTFYRNRDFNYPEVTSEGYNNPCINTQASNEKALRFLAETVVQEHHRKLSLTPNSPYMIHKNRSSSYLSNTDMSPSPVHFQNHLNFLADNYDPHASSLDHLNQYSDEGSYNQRYLHRTRANEALHIEDQEHQYYNPSLSSRASSRLTEDQKLNRSYTLSPRRRTNLVDQHFNAIYPYHEGSLKRGRSTIKRKKKKMYKSKQNVQPEIHPLPSYNPEVLNCLLNSDSRPTYARTVSHPTPSNNSDSNNELYKNPVLSKTYLCEKSASTKLDYARSPVTPSPGPHRRPSIAMGVTGLKNRSHELLNQKLTETSNDSYQESKRGNSKVSSSSSENNDDSSSEVGNFYSTSIAQMTGPNHNNENITRVSFYLDDTHQCKETLRLPDATLAPPPSPQAASAAITQVYKDLIHKKSNDDDEIN